MSELETKVTEVLDTLGQQLGVGVEHFWPLIVKQQVVVGFADLIVGMLLIILLVNCIFFIKVIALPMRECDLNRVPAIIIPCFVGALSTILGVVHFYSAILHLLNPEYYALTVILERVGG